MSCNNEFTLLGQHTCSSTSKKPIFDSREPIDGEYGVLETEKNEMFNLTSDSGMVIACSWHPTRPILATASTNGTVRLWDLSPESRGISKKHINAGVIAQGEKELQRQTQAILDASITLDPTATDGVASTSSQPNKKRKLDGNKTALSTNVAMVSMCWNTKGNKLAVGNFEGKIFVYNTPNNNTQPHLSHTIHTHQHKAPITVVRFSRGKGDLLLSCGADGSVCVWDMNGKIKQEITMPQNFLEVAFDADWRDGQVFAVCGVDTLDETDQEEKDETAVDATAVTTKPTSIWLCHVNYPQPVLRLARAHRGDINTLRWCPQGLVLASGAEDGIVKLWRPVLPTTEALDEAVSRSDEKTDERTQVDDLVEVSSLPVVSRPRTHGRHLLHSLIGHERGVTCVRFNDIGVTNPVNAPTPDQVTISNGTLVNKLPSPPSGLYVASGSLDTTARVWDVAAGQCRAVLSRHVHPVTGLSWSGATEVTTSGPNASTKFTPGTLLATHSAERVHIWNILEATIIKTLRVDAPVSEVSWAGNQLAIGVTDGSVCIMDAKL